MKLTNADIVVLLLLTTFVFSVLWFTVFRGVNFRGILGLFENKTGTVVHGGRPKSVKTSYEKQQQQLSKLREQHGKPDREYVNIWNNDLMEAIGHDLEQAKKEGLSLQKFAEKVYALARTAFPMTREENSVFSRVHVETLHLVFSAIESYSKQIGVSGSKQVVLSTTDNFLKDAIGLNTIQNAIASSRGRTHFNERAEAMMNAIIVYFTMYVPTWYKNHEENEVVPTSKIRSHFMQVAIKEHFEDQVREYEKLSEGRKNHARAEELKKANRRRNNREKRQRR